MLGCVFSRIARLFLPVCAPLLPGAVPGLCLVSHSAVALQVLHQLRRLGMVWQDVLPVNVYCKAMGTLLNTALAEIVTRIVALEVTAMGGAGDSICHLQKLSPKPHFRGAAVSHRNYNPVSTENVQFFISFVTPKINLTCAVFSPLQDISAEDADRLYSLCRTMVEEAPQVFTPLLEEDKNKKYQEEVPVYVQNWMTFKELMIILQANLQEIVDQ